MESTCVCPAITHRLIIIWRRLSVPVICFGSDFQAMPPTFTETVYFLKQYPYVKLLVKLFYFSVLLCFLATAMVNKDEYIIIRRRKSIAHLFDKYS